MLEPTIKVVSDLQVLAEAAAQQIVEAAESTHVLGYSFSLALSGGNTPRTLYQRLASEPWRDRIDWSKVEIYFSDERCVPPDHADSNFRMACQTLLDHVPIPYENIHRMRGEIDPQIAADEYEKILREKVAQVGLDLVLLGMGTDAHTASLFPNTPALSETTRLCVPNYIEKLATWRLTLTAPFINQARAVLILVSGPDKAASLQQALEGPQNPLNLPIQLIHPVHGRLTWIFDAPAAGME